MEARGRARVLWSRRNGTFVIMTAVGLLTFLGFMALVTDVGFTYADRQQRQSILDAAGLATLASLDSSDTVPFNQNASDTRIRAIYAANGLDPSEITTVTFTAEANGGNIYSEADYEGQVFLGGLAGINSWSVQISSWVTGDFVPVTQNMMNGFGLFGCSSLVVDEGAFVDAYKSSLGAYEGPPDHVSSLSPTVIADSSRWSGDDGYAAAGNSCKNGTNCSARVAVGAFGYTNMKAGGSPTTLYGAVWADGDIDVNISGTYIDRDLMCPNNCTISVVPGVTVNGIQDVNAPQAADSSCDYSTVMPCDMFVDDPGTGAVQARLADPYPSAPTVTGPHFGAVECGEDPDGNPYQYDEIVHVHETYSNPGEASYSFEAGKIYHFTEMKTVAGATITFSGDYATKGPPIIFVEGTPSNNTGLDFAKEPTIAFDPANTICKDGMTPCNSTEWTKFLGARFLGGENADTFDFRKALGGDDVVLDVVAPHADVILKKNMGLNGRVIGSDITIDKDAIFHYDEDLGGGFGVPPSDHFDNVRLRW